MTCRRTPSARYAVLTFVATLLLALSPASGALIILSGGTTSIHGTSTTHTDALGHAGYHINNDGLALDLNNNAGMAGGGDPTTFNNFEGLGTLTNGPGNRGLDFNNDADFRAVVASILDDASGDGRVIDQNDNYSNLWVGTLHVAPAEAGNWQFRNAGDDDRAGMWLDLDQDGIFESSTPGLGSNRGEQLSWEDGGTKTVALGAGDYLIGFTHREGGGGSRADFRFKSPTMGGQVIIKPADAAQAGLWSYTETPTLVSTDDVQLDATSTIDINGSTQLRNLTTTAGGLQLSVTRTPTPGAFASGSLEFTGTTTLGGDTTFAPAAGLPLTLNNVGESAVSALTASGTVTLILPTANTYTGVTTIQNGATIEMGNNASLGTEAGKTIIEAGGTLDIKGYRAGATGNELVEVEGTGVGGVGAIINTGGTQTSAFRRITMTGDATFRSDARWDTRNTGGAATLDMNGHTLTKVGGSELSLVNTTVANPGSVNVNQGLFRIEGSTQFGGAGTITVNGGTTLDFWNNTQTHSPNLVLQNNSDLTINGGSGAGPTLTGQVTLNGTSDIATNSKTLTLTGQVTGGGGFNKFGNQTLTLSSGADNFTGLVSIQAGALNAAGSVGTAAGGVKIADGATLGVMGNGTFGDTILISGTGVGGNGALVNRSRSNTVTGPLVIGGTPDLGIASQAGTLTLTQDIDPKSSSLDFSGAGNIVVQGAILQGSGSVGGGFIDINEGNDLVGNRTGNSDRLFDALDSYAGAGQSDFVLQRHPISPTVAGVITPRMDFGGGTNVTQGDGTVLDRGDYNNGGIPPWQGLFNDLSITTDMDGDHIGGVWSGKIDITTGGDYTFTTRSDDGTVLFINGDRAVNNNKMQGMTNRSGTINLTAGLHDISVGFYEGGGGAGAQASYEGPDTTGRVIIPPSVLFNDVAAPGTFVTGGLRGDYYDFNNSSWNGGFNFGADEWLLFATLPADNVVMESLRYATELSVDRIDFGTGTEILPGDGSVLDRGGTNGNLYGGIGVNLGNDQVGSVFEGTLTVPENADYAFTTRSDDNSRVYVDINNDGDFDDPGELVASKNGGGMSNFSNGPVSLLAGPHAFKAVTGEGSGGAGFQVSWEQLTGATFARQLIGGAAWGVSTVPNDLFKTGSGTLVLNGDNTYTGITDIGAGTLLVNGTTSGQGLFTVRNGATLGGTGTIGAAVTVESGGILGPGLSRGELTTLGDLVMEAGAIYEWEMGVDGAVNDMINSFGDLQIIGPMTLSILDAGFSTPNSGGARKNLEFDIFHLAGPISVPGGNITSFINFDSSNIDMDKFLVWDETGVQFFHDVAGQRIYLTGLDANPIPEPATLTLLGLGLLAARRRRKR